MSPEVKKVFSKKLVYGIIAYVAVFLVLLLISYSKELAAFLNSVLDLFSPILLGLVIAYLCNPIFRFFEHKLFSRLRPPALRRTLSLICTYLVALIIIAGLVLLLLPQIIDSIFSFMSNYKSYVDGVVLNINGLFQTLNGILERLIDRGDFFKPITDADFLYSLGDFFTNPETGVLSQIKPEDIPQIAGAVFGTLADIIFAIFISIYLLASKEKRYAQVMKLRHALFDDATNKRITRVCTTADDLFGKFLEGKLLGSAIIGILLYIFLAAFQVPYALLIAAFSAIMSIIPVMGYLIGVLPSALFVFMTDADKILPYLIIVFVIYQIDVNIISPKLLGNNTGVSSLCVLVSICIMGNLWGLVGMVLAVPLAATTLSLLDSLAHLRLQKKRHPDDVENYYAPDPIVDPVRGMSMGRGKLLKRLEKKALHAEALAEAGAEDQLTLTDNLVRRLSRWGRRHHWLRETPHELLTQFASEEATKKIMAHSAAERAEYTLRLTIDPSLVAAEEAVASTVSDENNDKEVDA